ncbi:hypothetical protein NDA11_002440 [Ustilago hordei]|nr:hypothetical protein NDA11_002440 [Ustilago hordei]
MPACLVNPLASLAVPASPLELLFLGMDDDTVVSGHSGSPPPALAVPAQAGEDYSPASPPHPNLYEVDAHGPPRELTTPERQALWEAKLARTPTPPPMADKVVDSILDAPRQGTPVYRLEVQPLTPPPWWRNRQTPPPPPPDHHLPTNGEIAGWAKRFIVADVVAQIAAQHYPLDWDRDIPAHPGMEYPGDGTPSLQPWGSHQAEQAHLTMAGGDGPGLIRLEERTFDPVMTGGWVTTMWVVFHLCRPGLVSSILQALQLFVEHHDQLYSERQPHESVTESGSPPDPIDEWVAPTEEELVIHSSLAPPPPPSSYVDM